MQMILWLNLLGRQPCGQFRRDPSLGDQNAACSRRCGDDVRLRGRRHPAVLVTAFVQRVGRREPTPTSRLHIRPTTSATSSPGSSKISVSEVRYTHHSA